MEIIVEKKSVELLKFLQDNYHNKSKNNLKNFLKYGLIKVNNYPVTSYNYLLKKNDIVQIIEKYIKYNNEIIEILYEDHDLIAVNKPNNLLCVASVKERNNTLYTIVSNYVKKASKYHKIFIVHRLDKDTSGIVLFAKNERVKEILQNTWQDVKRDYLALVHGKTLDNKRLENYLLENKQLKTYIANSGKLAITDYQTLKTNGKYSLIAINIKTGRKNQIRVQLAADNHPILGDRKYGKKDNANRMFLHACKLTFNHPFQEKIVRIISYPKDFKI